MKLSNLFCAVFAFTSIAASAQINQTPVHTGGGQIYVSGEKAMAATGSMFIDENYMPAKVSTSDITQLLRYNAYSDFFQMSNPQEQTVKILPKQAGVKITFNQTGESYILQEYKTEKGESLTGYLNIISDTPKVKIFKRQRVYLQSGSVATDSYKTSKAPAYKKASEEFYVKVGDAETTFFSGKKDFAKLVPGKSKEVLDYIKKNDIDLDEAAGLQKLAEYVQSIL